MAHVLEPLALEYAPAAHAMQELEPLELEYEPALQLVQLLEDVVPVAVPYCPAAQVEAHAVTPATDENDPAAHATHAVALLLPLA